MSAPVQTLLGLALIVGGIAVAVTIPDTKFLIFTGRPFGVVLAIVGAFDLLEGLTRRRRRGVDARRGK